MTIINLRVMLKRYVFCPSRSSSFNKCKCVDKIHHPGSKFERRESTMKTFLDFRKTVYLSHKQKSGSTSEGKGKKRYHR